MLRFIWSPESTVYHDRDEITELCNTDAIKERKESDSEEDAIDRTPNYYGRRLCTYCKRHKLVRGGLTRA